MENDTRQAKRLPPLLDSRVHRCRGTSEPPGKTKIKRSRNRNWNLLVVWN